MREQIINLETAKLAKQKGFEESTEANYWILQKDHDYNYKNNIPADESKMFLAENHDALSNITAIDEEYEQNVYHCYDVPTQSLLQRWLREKYNIECNIIYLKQKKKYIPFVFDVDTMNEPLMLTNQSEVTFSFDTYEEALELCLEKALNYIK